MNPMPVWLLDIDGVINAAGKSVPTHAWPADAWNDVRARDDKGRSWRILAAQPVIDFIREVHQTGRAEIRWHSTWQAHSANVGDVLGLPTFGVQHAPEFLDNRDYLRRNKWWKYPAALRVLGEEGRPLVWTDDDAGTDLSRDERAELTELGRVLIVSPDHTTGLCRRHLRQIDAFLAGGAR